MQCVLAVAIRVGLFQNIPRQWRAHDLIKRDELFKQPAGRAVNASSLALGKVASSE